MNSFMKGAVAVALVSFILSSWMKDDFAAVVLQWFSGEPASPEPRLTAPQDANWDGTQLATGRSLLELGRHDECFDGIVRSFSQTKGYDLLASISFEVHRNGDAAACDDTGATDIVSVLKNVTASMRRCPDLNQKYDFESVFTQVIFRLTTKCSSVETDRASSLGFYGFCDMGAARTPVLFDHKKLIPVDHEGGSMLPCHFHTYNGVRVASLDALVHLIVARHDSCQNATEQDASCRPDSLSVDLYAVPAGRMFMFAPRQVGEIIPLQHVVGGLPDEPVYLEVLSLSPRVFDLVNFFSREESAELVERSLKEQRDSHRIKRSSTGASGYNINKFRTSESGFDTSGKTALLLKRRCFDVLGFDQYIESFSDGLQILRYNLTTAYNKHMDWIQGNFKLEHDYDSGGKGGNRFATVLLYMTDLGEKDGGETVFTEAWPPGQMESTQVTLDEAISKLRESGEAGVVERGSWQERMVAQCRSRLAIKPQAGRAILFYSQLPNGKEDKSSLHGGCPVLSGVKYAANLWVWNTPRPGYPGNPRTADARAKRMDSKAVPAVKAIFKNSGRDPTLENAALYFGEEHWAKFGSTDPPVHVDTARGHIWRLVVNGVEIRRWEIDTDEGRKSYVV